METRPLLDHKDTSPASISLVPMLDPYQLKHQGEDWTGKSNSATRRKLQNRLNQRALRRRRGQLSAPQPSSTKASTHASPTDKPQHDSLEKSLCSHEKDKDVRAIQRPIRIITFCDIPEEKQRMLNAQNFTAYLSFSPPLPNDQKLLTLMHFNLMRALMQNTRLLGLDPDVIHLAPPSPFHNPTSLASHYPSLLPPGLRPTTAQLSIPHPADMDIFPFPEIRDTFILSTSKINDAPFCFDLLYGVHTELTPDGKEEDISDISCRSGRTGLLVWNDPWLPSSWELDEGFARKYKSLMKGCKEIIACTNAWREKRGEPLLDLGE